MEAGIFSRFAPLSYEKTKALIEVRGEILIETQLSKLNKAGVKEIILVTRYKSEQLEYISQLIQN